MCIIAIKPAGHNLPDDNTIETMWYNNPDGAGIMYPKNGMVEIKKGYTTLKSFKKAVKKLDAEIDIINTPIVLHFRIGTSGGNIPENTHPFPVTEKLSLLQKLQCRAPLAVAHNGIIDIKPSAKNISDTMEYVINQLGPLYQLDQRFYKKEAAKKLIYNFIQSKMAFLDSEGHIETIGDFVEENGLLYSNHSYKPYKYYKTWDIWDDYEYYNYTNKKGQKITLIPLCWIEEGYIMQEGQPKDGEYYLIDEKSNVYKYDWRENICYKIKNAAAYNAQGIPYKFDEELAEFMEVRA